MIIISTRTCQFFLQRALCSGVIGLIAKDLAISG
jgi:hypothetical protein